MEALLAALVSFGLVFVAELGDRTQFVLFALATRHPRGPLFIGAAAGFLAQTLLAVIVGDRLGAWLPTRLVLLLGAALFLLLGLLALMNAVWWRPESDEPAPPSRRNALVTAFLFVLVAEFADKTQIASAALTATLGRPVAVFIGAFAALLASAALALVLGRLVAQRIPARLVRFIAAGAFLAAGAVMAVVAV